MHKSKLFDLLRTFELSEWREFDSYLTSKVKDDAEVVQLYSYIFKYRKNLEHKKLEQEYSNKEIFRNKTIKSFRNLMSILNSYIHDFITIKNLLEDENDKAIHLAIALNKRKLYAQAHSNYETTLEEVQKNTLDLWSSYRLHKLAHIFHLSYNRTRADHIEFYLSESLKQNQISKKATNLLHQLLLYVNKDIYHKDLAGDINTLVEENSKNPAHNNLIELLEHMYTCISSQDSTSYYHLYDKIISNDRQQISQELGALCYNIMINYQNSRIRLGNGGSISELYEIYKKGLSSQLILVDQQIKDVPFMQYIHTAAATHQFAEARNAIEQYHHLLGQNNKESVLTISKATILLYEGKHAESNQLLLSTKLSNRKTKNQGRILELINDTVLNQDKEFLKSRFANFKRTYKNHNSKFSEDQLKGAERLCEVLSAISANNYNQALQLIDTPNKPLIRRSWLKSYVEKNKAEASASA